MKDHSYKLTEKDLIAIKIGTEYQQMSNLVYSQLVLNKIGLLIDLINSLYNDKIKMPEWKTWSEPLIVKLCFHASSMIKLFEGTELPVLSKEKKPRVIDEPTIITLLRVITENYLTFFYLYCDEIPEDEKQFRVSIWRYCGIKQRIGFEVTTDEAKNKQKQEELILEKIKTEIIGSGFFKKYDEKQQKTILKGKNPRLFNGWIDLIKASGIRLTLFKNLYGFKSNYSHSEFISVLQMNTKELKFDPNSETHYTTLLLHLIVCRAIINLKDLFPSVNAAFSKFDKNTIYEIDILNHFGITQEFDKI